MVEAALAVPNKELFFVPVSIGYDRLVEGSAYVRELTGGEKIVAMTVMFGKNLRRKAHAGILE